MSDNGTHVEGLGSRDHIPDHLFNLPEWFVVFLLLTHSIAGVSGFLINEFVTKFVKTRKDAMKLFRRLAVVQFKASHVVNFSRVLMIVRLLTELESVGAVIGWIVRLPAVALGFELWTIFTSTFIYVLSDAVTAMRYVNVFAGEDFLSKMVGCSVAAVHAQIVPYRVRVAIYRRPIIPTYLAKLA